MLFGYLINFRLDAQTTLSGYVYDAQSREPLIGATIFDSLTQAGTTANEFGYYRLFLKKQNVSLRISYVGYQTHNLALASLTQDTSIRHFPQKNLKLAFN